MEPWRSWLSRDSRRLLRNTTVRLCHRHWRTRPLPQQLPFAQVQFRFHSRNSKTYTARYKAHENGASTMTTTVKVVTVPSADTPGLCIHFHHERRQYVFGRVAEGTQRAYGSRKINWSGTEHVFLTGPVGWSQMGGLAGLLLSVGGLLDGMKVTREKENAERAAQGIQPKPLPEHKAQREAIDVHGGANLSHVLAASRRVIYRQPVRVRLHETRDDPRVADPANLKPDFEDNAIKVWKIPMRRARSSSPQKRCHNEAEETCDEQAKPKHALSDPELATLIVENCMFTGKLAENTVLAPKKLRDVKATDLAVVPRDGTLQRYTGPFAADGAAMANPDETAYVFPRPGEEWHTTSGERGIDLRDIQLPRTSYSDNSMSYIVKCHDRRGKFNAPKAASLGIKKQEFKYLAGGETITAPDGTVVTPDMVLGEQQQGNGIIVADIPSVDFLESFLHRPEWSSDELMKNIIVMYWSLPPGLAQDARIQQFVQQHAGIRHVFCAEDTCPNMLTHQGASEFQAKVRQIDSDRFPLLHFDNRVKYPKPPEGSPIELGRAGSSLMLMPRVEFRDTAAPSPDLVSAVQSMSSTLLNMARTAQQKARLPGFLAELEEEEKDIPNRDAEIIALGTGSSVPSKYRNVSGTLIRVPGVGVYLLDCGEGTLGQIKRMYEPEEVESILRNLRCIVVSHLHADHHMGTASLTTAWYQQALKDGRNEDTLAISCIKEYRQLLGEVSQIEDIGFHRLRFPNCPGPSGDDQLEVTLPASGENYGLASIKRVRVPHCYGSHGTQLELTSGLRIAYSGDTRPSTNFARAFQGAHLLVHECTFGDDMASHARAKRHSTMGEAIGIARAMKARRTLLTHFSQRYVKGWTLSPDKDAAAAGNPVLLAFDFMKVRLGEFRKAVCYLPAIQRLIREDDDAASSES